MLIRITWILGYQLFVFALIIVSISGGRPCICHFATPWLSKVAFPQHRVSSLHQLCLIISIVINGIIGAIVSWININLCVLQCLSVVDLFNILEECIVDPGVGRHLLIILHENDVGPLLVENQIVLLALIQFVELILLE